MEILNVKASFKIGEDHRLDENNEDYLFYSARFVNIFRMWHQYQYMLRLVVASKLSVGLDSSDGENCVFCTYPFSSNLLSEKTFMSKIIHLPPIMGTYNYCITVDSPWYFEMVEYKDVL